MLLRPLEGGGKRWLDRLCPLTTVHYHTSKGVHGHGGTFVLAGPQAAQDNLPEAWELLSVPSLSPKSLSQHIPEATKQTPLPHGPPLFTPARAITQVGLGRLVALWAWAYLISAWACIVLGIGGLASGSGGVGGGGGCSKSFGHLGHELAEACKVP